jgi:hypothetical protein
VQRYKILSRFASISSIIFQKDSDLTFPVKDYRSLFLATSEPALS